MEVLESNVSLFVRALAIKNGTNAVFLQVARIPNLASRQYRPRNHGRHLNLVQTCLHRHGAD
jgi:hypothetical protein